MTEKTVISIIGATGNIGSRIARELLERQKKVRVLGRKYDRLKNLEEKGADAIVGSVEDASALAKLFRGAQAAFVMIPPNLAAQDLRSYQNKVADAIVSALKESNVKWIVGLSSVGAHLDSKTGPILGLHDFEKKLNTLSGAAIMHLRPSYFMENLFSNIEIIKSMGVVGSPLKGTLSIPMIATKDIAAVAADLLAKLNFSGTTVKELLGERDLTMSEVTKVFAKAIGRKEITYVQFPYEDAAKAMAQMGISKSCVDGFIEMAQSFNDRLIKPLEARSPHNTTPTSIEDFAQGFAEIYESATKVPVG